jgi:hypothetical protein
MPQVWFCFRRRIVKARFSVHTIGYGTNHEMEHILKQAEKLHKDKKKILRT